MDKLAVKIRYEIQALIRDEWMLVWAFATEKEADARMKEHRSKYRNTQYRKVKVTITEAREVIG